MTSGGGEGGGAGLTDTRTLVSGTDKFLDSALSGSKRDSGPESWDDMSN